MQLKAKALRMRLLHEKSTIATKENQGKWDPRHMSIYGHFYKDIILWKGRGKRDIYIQVRVEDRIHVSYTFRTQEEN